MAEPIVGVTMFRMLTCFNLQPGIGVGQFAVALNALSDHMPAERLLESTGPIGRRQRHPVMDTDKERDHEFFFIMAFADRDQCDRAVQYMYRHGTEGDAIHRRVYAQIDDPVFICWEDIAPE